MSDLGQVLGSILAGMAQARRIADEQTVALAEYYRSTELLQGMSLPRVRIPEMEVDLPVLVESFDEGREPSTPNSQEVRAQAKTLLKAISERQGVDLPKTFLNNFDLKLKQELFKSQEERGRPATARVLEEGVDWAFRRALDMDPVKKRRFTPQQEETIRQDLRGEIRERAHRLPPISPSGLDVNVLTAEVKERGAPQNVARLKISLHEEGLEWTRIEQADGTVREILVPE